MEEIFNELKALASEEKKEVLSYFFKTGKGQYAEGDKFLGVTVPNIRLASKKHTNLDFKTIREILHSPYHEMRMCALLILVGKMSKAKKDTALQKEIFDFYLSQTKYINNWDLVDLSAPKIVGQYLLDKPRDILYRLADSPLLWDNRIAIVSTHTFIRNDDFEDTYKLSVKMMHHPHDLIHKAIGWMLRETEKHNYENLFKFIEKYRHEMPRTMLRYAIEHFPAEQRKYLMGK